MLHASTKRLIDKLDEMTRKQRVSWEESDNGSIKHDTEGYRVTLTAAPHSLLLTDTLGREIETCSPEDFAGETDVDGRPYTEFVEDLYREAHRHARGAEKAISALLNSLDEADAEDETETETSAPLREPKASNIRKMAATTPIRWKITTCLSRNMKARPTCRPPSRQWPTR
jgi:hypothetical protein